MDGEWLAIKIGKVGDWRTETPNEPNCCKELKPRAQETNKSAWAYVKDEEAIVDLPLAQLRSVAWVGKQATQLGELVPLLGALIPNVEKITARLPFRLNATLELQAVALLLFSMQNGSMPSEVIILSLKRSELASELVHDEPAEHIAEPYDHTHRGLAIKQHADLLLLVKSINGRGRYNKARVVHEYTVDELKPLLRELLDAGLLRDKFARVAEPLFG